MPPDRRPSSHEDHIVDIQFADPQDFDRVIIAKVDDEASTRHRDCAVLRVQDPVAPRHVVIERGKAIDPVDATVDPNNVPASLEIVNPVAVDVCLEIERVIPAVTKQHVIAGATIDRIVTGAAVNPVIAVTTHDHIAAGSAIEPVAAGIAMDDVVTTGPN